MEITISIAPGKLVTHCGKRPFNMPPHCPICGEAMRLKEMTNGPCDKDPYYFRFECPCCETEVITEADEADKV